MPARDVATPGASLAGITAGNLAETVAGIPHARAAAARRGMRSTIAADGFDYTKPYEPANPVVVSVIDTQPTAAAAGKPDPLRRGQRPIAVLLGGLGRK